MQDETTGGSGRRTIPMLLDEGYVFNMDDYISRGWRIFKSNLALMVVYTIIIMVISGVVGAIDANLAGEVRMSVRQASVSYSTYWLLLHCGLGFIWEHLRA